MSDDAGGSFSEGLVSSEERACPKCSASVRVPDPAWAWIAVCPSCNGRLDVGTWAYLGRGCARGEQALRLPEDAEGHYADQPWRIVGAVLLADDENWRWHEVLLWHETHGERRWVTLDDGHVLFEVPWPADTPRPNVAQVVDPVVGVEIGSTTFKRPASCSELGDRGRVISVAGCVDHEVAPNDAVRDATAVSPPFVLSARWEVGASGDAEVGLERWVPREDVLDGLPGLRHFSPELDVVGHIARPTFPTRSSLVLRQIGAALGLALIVAAFVLPRVSGRQAFRHEVRLADVVDPVSAKRRFEGSAAGPAPETLSMPVRIEGSGPAPLKVELTLGRGDKNQPTNFWASFQVILLDDERRVRFSSRLEGGHYSGQDSDGSWSEGSRTLRSWVRGLPPGAYTLAVTGNVAGDPGARHTWPSKAVVEAWRGRTRGVWLGVPGVLILLWAGLGALLRRMRNAAALAADGACDE